jgi:hypothetical protein
MQGSTHVRTHSTIMDTRTYIPLVWPYQWHHAIAWYPVHVYQLVCTSESCDITLYHGKYTCTYVPVMQALVRIQAYMLADIVVAIPAVDLAIEAVV